MRARFRYYVLSSCMVIILRAKITSVSYASTSKGAAERGFSVYIYPSQWDLCPGRILLAVIGYQVLRVHR